MRIPLQLQLVHELHAPARCDAPGVHDVHALWRDQVQQALHSTQETIEMVKHTTELEELI